MTEVYRLKESRVVEESQRVEKLLLAACDSHTRSLLNLSDISIWSCGFSPVPTLSVTCKSREITEAIGIRQEYIKSLLERITGCTMKMSLHYKIPEGLVYFDTEGEFAPARWYLCNRKDCGKMKIPLPG